MSIHCAETAADRPLVHPNRRPVTRTANAKVRLSNNVYGVSVSIRLLCIYVRVYSAAAFVYIFVDRTRTVLWLLRELLITVYVYAEFSGISIDSVDF